jgi:hypothetical protein
MLMKPKNHHNDSDQLLKQHRDSASVFRHNDNHQYYYYQHYHVGQPDPWIEIC